MLNQSLIDGLFKWVIVYLKDTIETLWEAVSTLFNFHRLWDMIPSRNFKGLCIVVMADSDLTTAPLINGFRLCDWLMHFDQFQRFKWLIKVWRKWHCRLIYYTHIFRVENKNGLMKNSILRCFCLFLKDFNVIIDKLWLSLNVCNLIKYLVAFNSLLSWYTSDFSVKFNKFVRCHTIRQRPLSVPPWANIWALFLCTIKERYDGISQNSTNTERNR